MIFKRYLIIKKLEVAFNEDRNKKVGAERLRAVVYRLLRIEN